VAAVVGGVSASGSAGGDAGRCALWSWRGGVSGWGMLTLLWHNSSLDGEWRPWVEAYRRVVGALAEMRGREADRGLDIVVRAVRCAFTMLRRNSSKKRRHGPFAC